MNKLVKNNSIRAAAKKAGVYLWEVADRLGIADSMLSRKLRKEISFEETLSILKLIEQIQKEKSNA